MGTLLLLFSGLIASTGYIWYCLYAIVTTDLMSDMSSCLDAAPVKFFMDSRVVPDSAWICQLEGLCSCWSPPDSIPHSHRQLL